MWVYIIVIFVVLGIIGAIVEFVSDHLKVIAALLCVLGLGYLAYSWQGAKGILILIGIVILAVVIVFLFLVGFTTLQEHGENLKKTAEINKETELSKEAHLNEMSLRNELEKNCRWLGYMNTEKWKSKLPNYLGKQYETNFKDITNNFAIQMEKQNITSNDEWFAPYIEYILKHPQGSTLQKMVCEVNCPQLNITHHTSDMGLISSKVQKGTKRISKDVPPLFIEVTAGGEVLYKPSTYLQRLHGYKPNDHNDGNTVEINFEDL